MKVNFEITGDWFAGVVTVAIIFLTGWGLMDILIELWRLIT